MPPTEGDSRSRALAGRLKRIFFSAARMVHDISFRRWPLGCELQGERVVSWMMVWEGRNKRFEREGGCALLIGWRQIDAILSGSCWMDHSNAIRAPGLKSSCSSFSSLASSHQPRGGLDDRDLILEGAQANKRTLRRYTIREARSRTKLGPGTKRFRFLHFVVGSCRVARAFDAKQTAQKMLCQNPGNWSYARRMPGISLGSCI